MAQILYGAQPSGISVNGEGLVKAKPDVAQTTIAVDVTNPDPVAAQRDAATRMDKVIAKLKELGVAADDIKTNQYSLTPQYNYGQNKETPTLVGYRVVNSVAVTIKQLDKVGQILDAATTAGATSLQGVTFTIADPTSLQSQARAAAVKQARARADELAKAAGVSWARSPPSTRARRAPRLSTLPPSPDRPRWEWPIRRSSPGSWRCASAYR